MLKKKLNFDQNCNQVHFYKLIQFCEHRFGLIDKKLNKLIQFCEHRFGLIDKKLMVGNSRFGNVHATL